MKRDWNLIRDLLLDFEKENTPCEFMIRDDKIRYHMYLLEDASYIEIDLEIKGVDIVTCNVLITNAGHDFLNYVRDNEIWESIKEHVESKGLSINDLPEEILLEMASRS